MTKSIYLPDKEDVMTLGGHIEPILSSVIQSCYDTLELKGAEMPEEKTLANLPQTCESVYDRLDDFLANGLSVEDLQGSVKSLRPYACYQMTTLTSINFPELTSVSDYCFSHCTGLHDFVLPKVETIGNYSFNNATGLTAITENMFSVLTSIYTYAFRNCSSLRSVSLPALKTIGDYTFTQCYNITSMYLPELTSTGLISFEQLTSLPSINLPKIISLGQYAFKGCSSLKEITLGSEETPSVTTIATSILFDIMGTETITVWGIISSNNQWIASPASGSNLKNIYFPLMTGEYTLTRTNMFTNVPTTCIWHVKDGTIEYVEGAWTFIPSES